MESPRYLRTVPRGSNAADHSGAGEEQANTQQRQKGKIARGGRGLRPRPWRRGDALLDHRAGSRGERRHLRPGQHRAAGDAQKKRDEKKWLASQHDDPLAGQNGISRARSIRTFGLSWTGDSEGRARHTVAPSQQGGREPNNAGISTAATRAAAASISRLPPWATPRPPALRPSPARPAPRCPRPSGCQHSVS